LTEKIDDLMCNILHFRNIALV